MQPAKERLSGSWMQQKFYKRFNQTGMNIPAELTDDIKNRLRSIKGQMEGLLKMLETNEDPDKILIQFKAVRKALDTAHYLILDEVYRKALAIAIVETINSCPGNCGNEEKIEYFRNQFPAFKLNELTSKMKEIEELKQQMEEFNGKTLSR